MKTEEERAMNYVLSLLKFSDRTRMEIIVKLKMKKFNDDIISSVVKRIEDMGFINDERYAEEYIMSKIKKGKSIKFITQKLIEKGIDKNLITDIISKHKPSSEEMKKMILEFIDKRISRISNLPFEKKYSKILNFLIRQGYSYEDVKDILDEVFKTHHGDI